MRHAAVKPHILLIEPSPIAALLSSAELDAAGFEWTLAATAADALAWAAALFGPHGLAQPGAILVSLEPGGHLDAAALVGEIDALMRTGLLRAVPVFGMASRMTATVEAAAIAAGCQLLRTPLRAAAAQFLAALTRADAAPAVEPMPAIICNAA